jgi:hypothetical protein
MFKERLSDNSFLYRSQIFAAPADGTHNAIFVPRNGFVEEVWIHRVSPAGGTTATISVGFVGNGEEADVDAFLDTAAADADGTVKVTSSKSDGQPASEGKWFNTKSGAITLTATAGGDAMGTYVVMARITVIS